VKSVGRRASFVQYDMVSREAGGSVEYPFDKSLE
jgi:hypothetical protein